MAFNTEAKRRSLTRAERDEQTVQVSIFTLQDAPARKQLSANECLSTTVCCFIKLSTALVSLQTSQISTMIIPQLGVSIKLRQSPI